MGYAFFYFTRKSFNYVTPSLIGDLDFEKSDIGIIGMLFYLIYGFSKFISGSVSDHSNPCYFMGVGLIITGIINIAFGLSSSLYAFIFLWMSNAFFQAVEERFSDRVIPAISPLAHAGFKVVGFTKPEPVITAVLWPLI